MQGHEEDIEFEFVFVTLDPVDDETDLRVAVGAGHGSRASNNSLVTIDRNANRANHVLVELGGYASAPDVDPKGEFWRFIDVNWHTTDVWGTRDVLALAGSGFIGRYSADMTLPRENGLALIPSPEPGSPGYSLLPVSTFKALDESIQGEASADEILGHLRNIQRDVPGMVVPDALSDEVRERLRSWATPLCCGRQSDVIGAGHRRIWEHAHYLKPPTAILTTHLYRPTRTALRNAGEWANLWTWSLNWVLQGFGGVSAGIVIPVILEKLVPVRIRGYLTLEGGYVLAYDGSVTQGGAAVRLTYDWSYGRYISWYLASQYTTVVWNPTDDEFGDSFSLAGGLSLLIATADDRDWKAPFRSFRLRAGPRVPVGNWSNLLEGVGLELQLVLR
jgi:hypothetical protein